MPNRSRTVVIDAGHGGTSTVGASSPNHAVGPNGLLEKDLTLDLARRVRGLLGDSARVILTRDASVNLSLSERAGQAQRNDADLFVSIHWNGDSHPDVDATESWIARRANARSRRFARRIVDRLARITGAPNRGVRERDLGVLLPSRHAADTGACLIELAYLSNAGQARRLEHDDYRDDLARGIAESIREDLETGAPPAGTASSKASAIAMGAGGPADLKKYITNPAKESDKGLQAALSLLQRYEPDVTRSKIDFRVMDNQNRLYFEPDEEGESIWEGSTPVISMLQSCYDIVADHVAGKSDTPKVYKVIRTVAHEMFHLWRFKNKPATANPIDPVIKKQISQQLDKIRQRWLDSIIGNPDVQKKMGIPAGTTVRVWADIPAAQQRKIENEAVESDDVKGLFLKTSYLVEEMLTKLEEVPHLNVQDKLGSKADKEAAQDERFQLARMIQKYSEALQRMPKTNADVTDKLVEQTRQAMLTFVRDRYPHATDKKLDSYTVIFFLSAIERGTPPIYASGKLQSVPRGVRV